MSDILPIDPANIKEEEAEPIKIQIEEKEEDNTLVLAEELKKHEGVAEKDEPINKKIFDKPEKVEISKRTGKPKRKLTDTQLENLKKAREKSHAKRAAMKEGKDMVKAQKRLDIDKRKKEKLDKKLEEESIIELRQQIYQEERDRAHKDATWDEERLTKLMNTTISNFITERKKQKPVPKAFIPAQQQYQQLPPQQQPVPTPQYYTQQPYRATSHGHSSNPAGASSDVMSSLFGYNGGI
tara:strand:- start:213 stop:929 length:717 start_codon:yes stop_codon:yes gene_type:complete